MTHNNIHDSVWAAHPVWLIIGPRNSWTSSTLQLDLDRTSVNERPGLEATKKIDLAFFFTDMHMDAIMKPLSF